MFGRGVHHIHPYRQRNVASERAAKNSLRLVEPSPDRAGNRTVVSCEKNVGKIVSGPGFSGCPYFPQTEVRARGLTGAVVERVNQTRMHLVGDLGLDYVLFAEIALRMPNRSVLFFYPFQNVRQLGSPTAVWENRVGQC